MFSNNLFRGLLTLQAHDKADVFAQIVVGDRSVVASDELEVIQVPTFPDRYVANPNPSPNNPFGVVINKGPEDRDTYLAARFADYQVSAQAAIALNPSPVYFPVDVDVRVNKRLIVQYHDRSSLNTPAPVLASSLDIVKAQTRLLQENRPYDVAYVVTLYLEIEELVTPNSK